MAQFLASLERLMKRHDKVFLPGHGGRIQTPQRVVKAYIMHRKWREQTILACSTTACAPSRALSSASTRRSTPASRSGRAPGARHLEHLAARDLVAADGPGGLLGVFSSRAS